MWFFSVHSWLQGARKSALRGRPGAGPSRRPKRPCRPGLEVLEGRLVPATFTVTTPLDVVNPNDGQLSLREAITQANANPGADTIVLPAGLYRLALPGADNTNAAGDLDVTGSTLFQGAGADATVIDGQQLDRVFDVLGTAPGSIQVTFQGLTIRNGLGDVGGGGGIRVGNADLMVQDCVVTGNRTSGSGGGISNAALPGTGNVTLVRSTIDHNVAATGGGLSVQANGQNQGSVLNVSGSTIQHNIAFDGGGINAVVANLTNSTVSGNSTIVNGGGIHAGTLTLLNVTVTDNSARTGGGVFLGNGGTSSVRNSIIAQNLVDIVGVGPDVSGAFTSGGHNLIGDGSGATGFANGTNGDMVGTAANPIDPRLGPLANNGGPTQTHALLPGSPAINAGFNFAGQATDQRGDAFLRLVGSAPDIGAFEVQPPATPPPPPPSSPPPPPVVEIQVTRVKLRTRVDVVVDRVLRRRFFPFGTFTGRVQVLRADVNGDGLLDVIARATLNGKRRTRTFLT